MNDDDELAPMVDGLSGALCVFILVTTIFMISATDVIISNREGMNIQFNNSAIYYDKRIIEFKGGLRIPHQDIYKVRQDLKSMQAPAVYIYIPDTVLNREQKMVYNLAQVRSKINLNIPISYKYGDENNPCKADASCIYWIETKK